MISHIAQPGPSIGPCLFIGQDPNGRWIVRDDRNMCGGLFTNQADAIRFAMAECQRRPQSVIMLPDGLESDPAFGFEPPATGSRERAA